MSQQREPQDPLNQVLSGRPSPFVPVAPVYEGLGPLEFHWMQLRWRKWRHLLDAAGTDRLAVDYETYVAVELALYTETIDAYYPPPAWLALPLIQSAERISATAVVRRGTDLYWVSEDGKETWLPPNRAAYASRQVEERASHYYGLWRRGYHADQLGEVIARADTRPFEPTPEEVDRELASGRYQVARALLDRHPNELPLYESYTSPYTELLGLLGFQGMMTSLIEEPRKTHKLLAGGLPRPSPRLAAAEKLGVRIVFVEECLASADLISPQMYREFVFPYTKRTLEFYESRGFRTVLYFSGDLMPLLEDLKRLPWTALSFEEDRKNYGIDLAEVRRVMGPDRVLYGNINAYFLERAGDAEVLVEVRRQVEVGGADRFVLSAGSPFTPGTSLERVRFFCESTRLL